MAVKTYVLLESMDSDAPIFLQTPDGKRSQIRKIPRHRPYLQVTFQDEQGISKTIRYKANSNHILLNDQVEKEKIPANEKFTQKEREAVYFKFGILTTDKVNLQNFLESHPEYERFQGTCDFVSKPTFKLLDTKVEAKNKNEALKKRIRAANKIINLELSEAQAMLIRINGSFFKTPEDIEECQNLLTDFLDDTNEAGLDEILKDENEITIDQETTVLIGKLINAGKLSFDAVEGKVSKKTKDGKWVEIRNLSSEYSLEERIRLFSDFLNTDDGKALKEDLIKDSKSVKQTKEEKDLKT